MTADPDEDALAWAGETDPSHVDGPVAKPTEPPAAGVSTAPTAEPTPETPERTQTPAVLLVTYGILGGVFLIYTIGWVTAILRLGTVRSPSADPLTEFMFALGEALAVASPLLWFGTVFLLTRGRKPIQRLLWILVGLMVVVPWPFLLGVWA
jgi:hypothetical protein